MTEEELSLFSEFLEQKEYARKDYQYLMDINSPGVNSEKLKGKKYPLIRKDSTTYAVGVLDEPGKKALSGERSRLAKDLNKERKAIQARFGAGPREVIDKQGTILGIGRKTHLEPGKVSKENRATFNARYNDALSKAKTAANYHRDNTIDDYKKRQKFKDSISLSPVNGSLVKPTAKATLTKGVLNFNKK